MEKTLPTAELPRVTYACLALFKEEVLPNCAELASVPKRFFQFDHLCFIIVPFLIKPSLNDLENYSRLWSFLLSIRLSFGETRL